MVLFLRDLGWSVTFIAQNNRADARYVHNLEQLGVTTYCGFGKETQRLFASAQNDSDCGLDLAMFAFWYLAEEQMPLLREVSPQTRIIVESIDLHFVRNARRILQGDFGGEPGKLDANYAQEMMRELNVYSEADAVLTVSSKEAELINDLTGNPSLTFVVPDSEDLESSPVPFEERKGILFVGNFRHPPNVDAVGYLCHKVLPLVDPQLLAEHPLYIVGNGLPDKVRAYAEGLANVKVVGWVHSLKPYFERLKISVIPLLYGAGTKRKLLQSIMTGTPTVSTPIGVEGVGLTHGRHALVAEDPRSFARSMEELLTDRQLWEKIAVEGRRWIVPRHGRAAAREKLKSALDAIFSKPPLLQSTATGLIDNGQWTMDNVDA
jgi:glycosyltransferase involved in cell wall biosynthesis